MKRFLSSVVDRQFTQMVLQNLRVNLIRNPGQVVITCLFPVLLSMILALAFHQTVLPDVVVAVTGADHPPIARAIPGLRWQVSNPQLASEQLRRGEVAAVYAPSPAPALTFDPTVERSRTARALVRLALADSSEARLSELESPVGSRYIDFLIPGLLALALLTGSLRMIGFRLIALRLKHLLKMLSATPMSRAQFLGSFLVSRLTFALFELVFFLGFGRLLFQVSPRGSILLLVFFAMAGTLSMSSVGLLLASRTASIEVAEQFEGIVVTAMLFAGVFFPIENFPQWLQPLVRILPLSALVTGLRKIMTDGLGWSAVLPELAILGIAGAVCFTLAIRIFKWR